MGSIQLLEEAALALGWVRTTCVHENNDTHIVYDYRDENAGGRMSRVHTDMDRAHRRTYIFGPGAYNKPVSLKNAIDFMRRVSEQYPKVAS